VDYSTQNYGDDLNGVCHKDARTLAKHVSRLETIPIHWARDQGFLLGDYVASLRVEDLVEMGLIQMPRAKANGKISHARVARGMITSDLEPTPSLIRRHALLGTSPEWHLGDFHVKRLLSHKDNTPIEDGPVVKIDGKLTRSWCPIEICPSVPNIA